MGNPFINRCVMNLSINRPYLRIDSPNGVERCLGGTTAPRKCPAGTFSVSPGNGDLKDCQPCPPGYMSLESGTACRPCPTGFSCDPVSANLNSCKPGQYSLEGELHCAECPDGFVCPDGRGWKLCPPGQEPAQNHSHCVDCPLGFFSTKDSPKCVPCLEGSYCPFAESMKPLVPQTGDLKDDPGYMNSSMCSNGTPCQNIAELQRSNAMGATCPPGSYAHMVGNQECHLCPAGHFCSDGNTATPCPAGTYSEKEGLPELRECTLCPAGYFCTEGSAQSPGVESLCPEGFYCPVGTRSSHAFPCPAGTYSDQLGQGHRGSCIVCSEGLFCQEGSSNSGTPCTRGKFCPAGTSREQDCPPGTFTHHIGASRIEQCVLCPVGFYCLSNTSYSIPCPAGTFNPLEGQDEPADCIPCPAGSACTRAGLSHPDTDCSPGYVCPLGSRAPTSSENACPAGTYTDSHNLFHKSQCDICPARFFCATGSGGRQRPPVPCPRGHYCPLGTKLGSQFKCPAGTWSDRPGLASDTECYPCPSGWFCLAGAESPSGKCSAGHYCPEGSQFGSQYPCPAGTFNLKLGSVRVGECSACPMGSYCPPGTSKPAMCPMGTYRAEQGARDVAECDVCPAGSFCPNIGLGSPLPCRAGTFSDVASSACLPCPAGHYCNEDRTSRERMMQLVCPAGHLCPKGMADLPEEETTLCPKGYYCPQGCIDPRPCANGTYGPQPGLGSLEECLLCPNGDYCYKEGLKPEGIPHPTGPCPQGYYCPPGTGFPFSNPCPSGFYWNISDSSSGIPACFPCPDGFFCDALSLLIPKICPAGFHCARGSSQPQPCPEGTYSSREGLSSESQCKACEAGQFCPGEGLITSSGHCKEGYYCPGRATSSTPSGGVCPAGSYCPAGSGYPTLCPPGSYSNQTALVSLSQCLECPPGMFCDGLIGHAPNGYCRPGYYCPVSSSSPVQNKVMEGFFSLEGAFRPEPCPPGTFQPLRGQSTCRECPPGTFCNQSGLAEFSSCPQGHFCPSECFLPMPCPVGTFSNISGNPSIEFCELCSVGMYCSRPGMVQPEGYCHQGYYCRQGSSTSTPVGLRFGDICPAGHFCTSGLKHPCSPGTYNERKEAEDIAWCLACPPGSFCDTPALIGPTGLCQAGFFCILGATSPRPQDGINGDICPKRHFCPEGSSSPIPCPEGTYSNTTGQITCNLCPIGYTCSNGDIILCPPGYFCLDGSESQKFPCPPGTFNPTPGVHRFDGCLPCPPGMFCSTWGSSAPSGPCQGGYFCTSGSLVHNPTGNLNETFGGPCPIGHFCPPSSGIPVPCPIGTYSDRLSLSAELECIPCPPGYYCNSAGQSAPTGLCLAGYYCAIGVSSPAPIGRDSIGDGGECSAGHYCPQGSALPSICPSGTYNNLTRQEFCLPCPAGFYCPENTTNYIAFPCPSGFYCPKGTKHAGQFPCPRGYFNPDQRTQSLDSCLPCTPGHYCGTEGLSIASGKCDPGWFCVSAAWTPQPFDLDNYTSANCLCPATATGGKCLPGFYCPEGTTEPVACPPGRYCESAGLPAPTGECSAGFFCMGGSRTPNPIDPIFGGICPPGTLCTAGSHHPQPCPAGTYSGESGLGSESECKTCLPGYYCNVSGLTAPSGLCAEGFYCPERHSSSNGYPCPKGHHCPAGSSAPVPCEAGSYQNKEKQNICLTCEAGFYCDDNEEPVSDFTQFSCPQGYFCPAGTQRATHHSCPDGTYGANPGLTNITECVICPPGKYCKGRGQTEPTGYWCKGGAKHPQDGLSGNLCPAGYYCTEGTHSPSPCPVGTWSNSEGMRSISECHPCPGGHYCNATGQMSPTGICAPGYYCTDGAKTSTPNQGSSGGLCPSEHFCPAGSATPSPCPPGTYMPHNGAVECYICPSGKYCIPEWTIKLCPRGFYCPSGTGFDWKPCPLGTYSAELGLESVSGCRVCDGGKFCSLHNATEVTGDCSEGYYCTAGAQVSNPEQQLMGSAGPCPPGHYCPQSSTVPIPCPPGTFSSRLKLHSEVSFLTAHPCPAGLLYCNTSGLVTPTGQCSEGFYCVSSSTSPYQLSSDETGGPCPQGTFSAPWLIRIPQPCPLETYNAIERQSVWQPCVRGFFCPGNTSTLTGQECPPGFYCPSGTISPEQHPCPRGTYNPQKGGHLLEHCLPCDPGHFCNRPGLSSPTGTCDEGYFCRGGSFSSQPSMVTSSGGPCPPGYFCPRGSQNPQPCPAGSYSVLDAQGQCSECPVGFYCPAGATDITICPEGYYCPKRTVIASQYPCPQGTFNEVQGAIGDSFCLMCTPGMFCSKHGLERPDGICAPGWYCPAGSVSEKPIYYPDIQGNYCAYSELAAESGPCDAGYYCTVGAFRPNPQDGETGNLCPPGHFCSRGTSSPSPCPPGTFLAFPGAQSLQDCYPCTAGSYCPHWGQSSPEGYCTEGWYCPVRSLHPQNPEYICPIGHFCPTGSFDPKICPVGQYQDRIGQSQCKICPVGKFCGPVMYTEEPVESAVDIQQPRDCPAGYYCVPGTEYGYQHPCPRGTFSNKTGLVSIEGCVPCPGGWFCATPGLSSPSGHCLPGFYCVLKAQIPNPEGDETGSWCPSGYYCPAESSSPFPCPMGTYQPYQGMSSHNSCLPCPVGKFCKGEGLPEVSGNCLSGFYCVSRAIVESPADGVTGAPCPKGHFCPSGAAAPIACMNGFFQDLERATSCKTCPAGSYCNTSEFGAIIIPQPCPAGHFCPKGSESGEEHKCPRGTYGPKRQLKAEAECTSCPAGFYCAGEGLTEPSGPCQPGYWCIGAAKISNPTDGVTGTVCPKGKFCSSGDLSGKDCHAGYFCDFHSTRPNQKLCPPGFYCPTATEAPLPCDSGTYAPRSGSKGPEDCQLCPSGHFCNGTGQASWQGPCSPGFYCPPGQISPRPSAYRCPSGFFCSSRSSTPTSCESGTYQAQEGKESCNACPTGFYCGTGNGSLGIILPKLCPTGHYCPPGASFITVHPCPAGTYGPKTGASSKSDCEPCPAGMYCATFGLLQPTGYCYAGYYCSQGAVNPTPISPRVPYSAHSLPENDICPAGHFCPNGTISPMPCPPGSYSMASGLSSQEECQPCPAGHYCPQSGMSDLSQVLPCSSGFICKEGSSVSCPSNEIHGYRCPVGFYCPSGATVELPCEPGTFSPMPGASSCLPCPPGRSCEHVSMVEPVICPRGNYCPAMTVAPVPCPEGTLSPLEGALSFASCKRCPAGRYCRGEANWEPDGLCSAGYYCEGGAADSIPQKTARFLLNGPCPTGHYCPEGTQSPKPCPVGTLKNSTGGVSVENCMPCYAGHFCASVGLSSPTGVCAEGFYCPANFTSVSPTALICPKGHFCPIGASHPTPCPTGQYQPNTGSHFCIPCQPGFYCQEAVSGHPQPCPPHSYCPTGALFPLPCPDGTFTTRNVSGLRVKGECLPCPPGQYCRAGKLQGPCAAGHFCLAGSSEYTPHVQNFSRSSLSECNWGQMCAGICPAGFYCQEGTALPRPCPANTLRASPGARHRDDCLSCPLGRWCREGNATSLSCPAGHYCSAINQTDPNQPGGPQQCPVHTFRSLPGAERAGDCHPCPSGYFCKIPGIIMFKDYPCPPGHWCPGMSDPVPCPVGTLRTEPGAASLQDCKYCPEGHYCPDPAFTLQVNIMGIPCRPGYECPLGSISETVCRGGSYCTSRTGIPHLCPGGYFCPEGSATYNTSRQICIFPYYCPPGSSHMMPCTGGFRAIQKTGLRDSAETSCRSCEAGTYREDSATDVTCQPCPPGFSCPPGVTTYLQYPCQPGYYCPSGTSAPVPCAPGTYGNSSGTKHPTDCYPCPPGTYNHLSAQVACFPCGSSSFSEAGARSCVCRGLNRSFQESDGSCICQAGFVFYDDRQQKRSDSNSDLDCQPQVEERCAPAEVRLASTRQCVAPEQYDCAPFCGLEGGELSSELGLCHCTQYVSAEELCDRFCLINVQRISMSFGSNKQLLLHIEEPEKRWSRELEVQNVLGPDEHVWRSKQVHFVLFSPSGVFGVILSSTQVIEAFLTGDSWSVPTPRRGRSAEETFISTDLASLPRIPNPVLCLKQGDVVLFQLSITPNDRASSHYPVYLKNHLYNTNPHWDFGAFRRLDHLIRETNINISRFAHVYGDPGTYVFLDNGNKDRSLFITVKERNVECDPVASVIQPSSPYQLVRHAIIKQNKLNLAPDWGAILGVLFLLFIVMIILLILTVVLRPSLYSPNPMKNWKPKWKSLGEQYIPPEYILTKDSLQFYETLGCHGSGEVVDTGKKELIYGSDQRATVQDLENFNVRTLFDKLEDQNLHLTSQLGRHRNDTLSFYKAFIQRIQVLKELLQGLDLNGGKGSEWRDVQVSGEQGSVCTSTSHQSEESAVNTTQEFQVQGGQGSYWQEATALMKVLKMLLIKQNFEQMSIKKDKNKERKNRTSKEPNEHGLQKSCGKEQELSHKNPYTCLRNGEAPLLSFEGLNLHPLLFMTSLYREENLKMLMTASPLARTLEEIKDALKAQAEQEKSVMESATPVTESATPVKSGVLVPTDMSKLSPRQFTVYRFGCAILRLLCLHCIKMPLELLMAEEIPKYCPRQDSDNMRLRDSYYDTENNVLFIPSTSLEHVGGMITVIIHAVAQIKTGII
ncbi:LOW QUALITY PROTEIN: uncharacterized protein O3C94_014393 [Discoglossus pictus]